MVSCIQATVRLPEKIASLLTGGLISIALYYGRNVHVSISVSLATRRGCPVYTNIIFRKVRSEDAKISSGQALDHDYLGAAFILDPSCSLRRKSSLDPGPAGACRF